MRRATSPAHFSCFENHQGPASLNAIFLKRGHIADASTGKVSRSRIFLKALRLSHDRQA
jgi:hypothetical protein